MYRIVEDIPPFEQMVSKHIRDSNDDFLEKDVFLDISYFKTFNSNLLPDILDIKDHEHREDIEKIFLDCCLSGILQTEKVTNPYALTEYILSILDYVTEKFKYNLSGLYNSTLLINKLVLYVDALRNNIEYALNQYGLDKLERICTVSQFNKLEDKSYVIRDFTSLANTTKTSKHSLCIRIYERIDKS